MSDSSHSLRSALGQLYEVVNENVGGPYRPGKGHVGRRRLWGFVSAESVDSWYGLESLVCLELVVGYGPRFHGRRQVIHGSSHGF